MSLPKPLLVLLRRLGKLCSNSKRKSHCFDYFFGSFSANILFIIYLSFPWTAFEGWGEVVGENIRRKRGTGLIFCAGGHFPSLYIW